MNYIKSLFLIVYLISFLNQSFAAEPGKDLPDSTILYAYSTVIADSFPIEKYLYKYDAAGRMTQTIKSEYFKDAQVWFIGEKKDLTYDDLGNITSSTRHFWDDSTKKWIPTGEKIDNKYNPSGKLILQSSSVFDFNKNQWTYSSKVETIYSSNGKILLESGFGWNYIKNTWDSLSKKVIQYDEKGRQTLTRTYVYSEKAWVMSVQNGIRYDDQGRRKKTTDISWDGSRKQWNYNRDSVIAYDAKGNAVSSISSQYDEKINQWIPKQKNDYIIDPNGNILSHVLSDYNALTKLFSEIKKTENTYDSRSRLITEAAYSKEKGSAVWIPVVKKDNVWTDDKKTQTAEYENDAKTNQFCKKWHIETSADPAGKFKINRTWYNLNPQTNEYSGMREEKTYIEPSGRKIKVAYAVLEMPAKKLVSLEKLYFYYKK